MGFSRFRLYNFSNYIIGVDSSCVFRNGKYSDNIYLAFMSGQNPVDCKKIIDLDVCNSRVDCIVNRSKKCQKKPNAKKTKKLSANNTPKSLSPPPATLYKSASPISAPATLYKSLSPISAPTTLYKSLSPIYLRQSASPPPSKCSDAELMKMREQLNTKRKEYDTKIKECEEEMFGEFIWMA